MKVGLLFSLLSLITLLFFKDQHSLGNKSEALVINDANSNGSREKVNNNGSVSSNHLKALAKIT